MNEWDQMPVQVDEPDLIVVGGGAAGFFAAIEFASLRPERKTMILEKSGKVLSKVKVSGGGRCNVTHNCNNPFELARHYPRGSKMMKSLLSKFGAMDMVQWLAERKVYLHAEDDGRMFPVTNNSQTIIDCFIHEVELKKIKIVLNEGVEAIKKTSDGILLRCRTGRLYKAKAILIATGGNPTLEFYRWIAETGSRVRNPIPSLFTFNEPTREFADLMGLSVENAEVRIEGTKFRQVGPLLVTHWGFSGPAVIRLSAWAAEYLFENKYNFKILINWTGTATEDEIRTTFEEQRKSNPKQKIARHPLFGLPQRLWQRLCLRSEISDDKVWGEAANKSLNRLLEQLIRCRFAISGKTTFKEEFVTCGGVELNQIDHTTLESTQFPGVFFAGEVLDIDGETGGFNFQAAWTTGYLAARGVVQYLERERR